MGRRVRRGVSAARNQDLVPKRHGLDEKPVDSPLTHLQRMLFVVIRDKALDPVDVGLLGAVGIVLALSCAAREPDCIARLNEQLFGSLCHANLRKSGSDQGAGLCYDADWFQKEPLRGHFPEDFCKIQSTGSSTALFSIISRSAYLCREFQ